VHNPSDTNSTPRAFSLQAADGVGIACLIAILLLLSIFHSRHTMYSSDEIMTILVFRQPNFHSMLRAWRDGIDSGGIWFFVLGRVWSSLLGTSPLAIRTFSACGIAAAGATIWIIARRFYSTFVVAAGVGFVFGSSMILTWQLDYARTYCLFLFASALVLYLVLRGEDAVPVRPAFVLATMVAYALLMGSHILGGFYVAVFLCLQFILDLKSRRFRPVLYLSAIAASLPVFLFNIPNLRSTSALGKPRFWTTPPSFKDLITLTNVLDHRVTGALFFVLLLAFLHLRFNRRHMPVYLLAVVFALADLFLFAYSRLSTSIYVNRYLLPFDLVAILLLCELLAQLQEADAPMPALRRGLPALFLLLAFAGFFVPKLQRPWYPLPDYTPGLVADLPHNLPVVDADDGSFVELEFYQHDVLHPQLILPLDWPIAMDPLNTGGVSGINELENMKAHGFYPDDILTTSTALSAIDGFTRDNHTFVLLTNPLVPTSDLWLKRHILSNPTFAATKIESYPIGLNGVLDIWLVHTKS